jgi:hypothetical protein
VADTLTSRGLIILDPALNYDVAKFNANFNLLDGMLSTIVCTSTTRPSTGLFDGMTLWETDTKRFVVRGAWVPVPQLITVANQAARDAIVTKYDGMTVYRQDMDWEEIYDGTAWRVQGLQAVASLANITNPMTGQMAWLTTDGILYKWSGAAWQGVLPIGTVATAAHQHDAFYRQSGTAQVITAGADWRVRFDTGDRVTSDVTTATVSGGTEFTINRAGRWRVEASVRFGVGANNTERYAAIGHSVATSVRYAEQNGISNTPAAALPIAHSMSKTFPLNAGDKLCVFVYHNDVVSVSMTNTALHSNSISLTWLGV